MQSDEAYIRRITGEGWSFKETQQERVLCPDFRKELTKELLVVHCQTQHGVAKGGSGLAGDKADGGDEPRAYS